MTIRLVTAGLIVLMSGATGSDVDAQGRPEGMFERTLTVAGSLALDIRTGAGSVHIQRGAAATVRIVGRVRGRPSWFNRDLEARIRQIEAAPPVNQEGGMVRVGPMDGDRLYRDISISYDVTVPMDTRVQSRSGSGSQTIGDLAGPVDVVTGSGSVRLRAIQGDVRASTGSGSVQVDDVGGFFGRTGSGGIRASQVRGAVDARAGSGHLAVTQVGEADVTVETGSGGIEVSGARRALRARAGSGSIELEGRPAGDWKVETGSGGIRIDFPDDSAFALNVRTGSGSINTTHPLTVAGPASRNRLTGTVRGGGAHVELSTGSGSVGIN